MTAPASGATPAVVDGPATPTVNRVRPAGRPVDRSAPPVVRPLPPDQSQPAPAGDTEAAPTPIRAADLVHHRREPLFGRRVAVVYDVHGPRVRLGVLWFVAEVAGLKVGPVGVAVVFAAMAALAGWQTVQAWTLIRIHGHRWVAAAGAGVLPLAAVVSAQLLGGAILALVFLALAVTLVQPGRANRLQILAGAGLTVQSSLFVGLAGASMVLAIQLDIAAAVVLALFVAAYEAGDFLVGAGAGNVWEGPAAGIAAIAALSLCAAVLRVAPFDGADVWTFAALAAVACPLGQVAASVLLPAADARAPALRRLDSLLVLGPAWAALIGLYLSRVA